MSDPESTDAPFDDGSDVEAPAVDRETAAVLTLRAILEMSDRAEGLGGARSIAGIASLHAMQRAIQNNRPRIIRFAIGKEAV